MEFGEVLKGRRSCRDFASDPVSEDQIQALIEACTWAPSPLHLQPWSFLVITGAEGKAKVMQVAEEAKQAVIAADGPGWVQKYGLDFLEQAPVLIVACADPKKGGLGAHFNQPHGAMMAVGAGLQNLMLAAAEMGFGTLWFTFYDPDALKKALGIPENLEVVGVIPVGKPASEIKAPPRKEPKVFREEWPA